MSETDRKVKDIEKFNHWTGVDKKVEMSSAPGGQPTETLPLGKLNVRRILFLGNSITLHGPRKEVSWTGNWGMAASCLENDYVHVLTREIAEKAGERPDIMVKNIASLEREQATYDIPGNLQEQIDFRPNVLILAIGENAPQPDTPEARECFHKVLHDLLAAFTGTGKPRIFVRSSFWPNEIKDTILKEVCAESGGTFVDIGELSKDESNFARSEREYEHSGVAAHPGDGGMKAIAAAILKAMTAAK